MRKEVWERDSSAEVFSEAECNKWQISVERQAASRDGISVNVFASET